MLQKDVKDVGREVNDTELWCNAIKNSKEDDFNINRISSFNKDLIQQVLYNEEILENNNSIASSQ